MRVWHIIFAVFLVALLLTIARDPTGRVAVVVFVCGVAEIGCGIAALMMLFQTVGSFGQARGTLEHVQSALATGIVLLVASAVMLAMLAFCVVTIQRVV